MQRYLLETLLNALSGWARDSRGVDATLAKAAASGEELVALVVRLYSTPERRVLDVLDKFADPPPPPLRAASMLTEEEETPELVAAVGACFAAAAVSLMRVLGRGSVGQQAVRRGPVSAAPQAYARLAWQYVLLGRRCVGSDNFALEFAAALVHEAAELELMAWQLYARSRDLLAALAARQAPQAAAGAGAGAGGPSRSSSAVRAPPPWLRDPRWSAVIAALMGDVASPRAHLPACAARLEGALKSQCRMSESDTKRAFRGLLEAGPGKHALFHEFSDNMLRKWGATKVLKCQKVQLAPSNSQPPPPPRCRRDLALVSLDPRFSSSSEAGAESGGGGGVGEMCGA